MNKATVSLADLNLTKQCEEGFKFEYLDPAGNGTGVFVTVVGAQAPAVKNWMNAEINSRRRHEALSAQASRDVPVRMFEDDEDKNIEYVSIRIIGWDGISEPFTPANAFLLCKSNSLFTAQVKLASERLENFIKSK